MFLDVDFSRALDKGEETDICMAFDLVDSFCDPRAEYCSLRVNHPTELIQLVVRFRGFERFTTHEALFDVQPTDVSESDRPTLAWDIPKPNVGCA